MELPKGIPQFHEQDVAATKANDADQLANLWTPFAVRIFNGSVNEGKEEIIKVDKAIIDDAKKRGERLVEYSPAIKTREIVDGVVFEWGSARSTVRKGDGDNAVSQHFKTTILRVLQRQSGGEWKIACAHFTVSNDPDEPCGGQGDGSVTKSD
jgi:uncharacterized protein (TIGR02246 family)